MACARKAAIQAMAHCPKQTVTAHFVPSSRLMAVKEAIHGVYSRQKTRRAMAQDGVSITARADLDGTKIFKVETTLSFAMIPVISAVENLQSSNPSGLNIGEILPAISAKRLSLESFTRLKCRSKLCRNQIIMVARKITVNAFCRKSFAFSHNNWPTFLALGRR